MEGSYAFTLRVTLGPVRNIGGSPDPLKRLNVRDSDDHGALLVKKSLLSWRAERTLKDWHNASQRYEHNEQKVRFERCVHFVHAAPSSLATLLLFTPRQGVTDQTIAALGSADIAVAQLGVYQLHRDQKL